MKSLLLLMCFFIGGCATGRLPLKTVEKMDLEKFMGPWYVIACIPTFIETKAYNAVEDYTLLPDGTIGTVFTFNKGSFDGPLKKYTPRGFVKDKINNSTWGMQFIWPFKSEYLITYLTPDYTQTIISRNKRDYFWIMARTPEIADKDYEYLLNIIKEQGYDVAKARKVPHR